jgi:hypothetical protein
MFRSASNSNAGEETSNQSNGLAVSSTVAETTGEATASMTFVRSAIHCDSVIGRSEIM